MTTDPHQRTISIQGSRVVAAMTPPTSKSPFNRSQLIVRADGGVIVRVRAYTEGRVGGHTLTAEDLEGLIEAEHAIELTVSIPLVSGAVMWVLRRNMPYRDTALQDLWMTGCLVYPPLVGTDDARLCCVNEGIRERALLERWRDNAMREARVHAEQNAWGLALIDAEFAQAVTPGIDHDVLKFLSLAYERCGRRDRASALLGISRRSLNQCPTNNEGGVMSTIEKFTENTTGAFDVNLVGDGELWKLLCRVSSPSHGWTKSTMAMDVSGSGCLVRVTTEQGDHVTETLAWVPGVHTVGDVNGGRKLAL